MMIRNPLQRGISVVEILVVVSIVSVAIFSLYELVVLSRATSSNQMRRLQAVAYAQEGIEAVRNLRDRSWDNNIAPVSTSSTYYLTLSGSAWALTTTNPGPLDSLFSRTITFASVMRDSNGNISASGTPDDDTRQVTVTVTWTERGQARSLTLPIYLTNFLQ